MESEVEVYLGLGSNLGDREGHLRAALEGCETTRIREEPRQDQPQG